MTTAVVNASPPIFLGNAGRLELLRTLGHEAVLVPEPVFSEVARGVASRPDRAAKAVAEATWLVRVPASRIPAGVAAWDLGYGESSVIATALERTGARVVIDDLAGRRCARALGLTVSGTVGVVVEAARVGMVGDPLEVIEELRAHGMWLSNEVVARVRAQLAADKSGS